MHALRLNQTAAPCVCVFVYVYVHVWRLTDCLEIGSAWADLAELARLPPERERSTVFLRVATQFEASRQSQTQGKSQTQWHKTRLRK